jgi:hypothetical protein
MMLRMGKDFVEPLTAYKTNPASSGLFAGEPGNLCLRKTAWWGSNLQPNDYQPPALSIEHSGAVS